MKNKGLFFYQKKAKPGREGGVKGGLTKGQKDFTRFV